MRRGGAALLTALLAWSASAVAPSASFAQDPYILGTEATYEVDPAARRVAVTIEVSLTNTTPDPEGQFSVFSEVLLAVHDEAAEVSAEDDEGGLEVSAAPNEAGVNVATVTLRQPLRYQERAALELRYVLADGVAGVRVRPSVVVFPAWSFGTSGEVSVELPATYEVRADGDPLDASTGGGSTRLESGLIDDPASWLALITATRPSAYTTLTRSVPLSGGTADFQVRAWADDPEWGNRTLELLAAALPLLEEEIGIPYPHVGPLVVTESVADPASGFGEATPGSPEILVAFDQPPFTALHQLAHVWIGPQLAEERWIREGLATHYAAAIAPELAVEPPFDPAARVEEASADAFPLDEWDDEAGSPARERYGYAASWLVANRISEAAGAESLRRVLQRVAADVGPYEPVAPEAPVATGAAVDPMTSRGLLDQLELVGEVPIDQLFAERVLAASDVELLPRRSAARASFAELAAAAGDWGTPDPLRTAMSQWQFDEAQVAAAAGLAWLAERDALLAEIEEVGLAAPQRLRADWMASGGGIEAHEELAAERTVVEAYAAALVEANLDRSFLERVGLLGGPDPSQQLATANALFAEGELRGAADAIRGADRSLADAGSAGVVRILSAIAIAVAVGAVIVMLLRRRGPTPRAERGAAPPATAG